MRMNRTRIDIMALLQTFECTICLDSKPSPAIDVAGDEVCRDRFESDIRGLFNAALEKGSAWPVTWGAAELKPDNFHDLFSEEFREQWRVKVIECRTAPSERVYCKHFADHVSVGGMQAPDEQENCGTFVCVNSYATDSGYTVPCFKCKSTICASCGEALISDVKGHIVTCKPTRPGSRDPMQDLPGLVRGKGIQFCPNKKMQDPNQSTRWLQRHDLHPLPRPLSLHRWQNRTLW